MLILVNNCSAYPFIFGKDRLYCEYSESNVNETHPGMVWVPFGKYEIKYKIYPEEKINTLNGVNGFWMDQTEITNDEYSKFIQSTGYITEPEKEHSIQSKHSFEKNPIQNGAVVFKKPEYEKFNYQPLEWWKFIEGTNWRHPEGPNSNIDKKGSFPVVAITYHDALEYAKWKGHSLPTETEWEWAASSTKTDSVNQENPTKQANTWQGDFPIEDEGKDGFQGISPVGCYEANEFGLYDMIGNVWEFTSESWEKEKNNITKNSHVIKGGSYLCSPNYCKRYRSAARQPQEDHLATNHIGFRTILRDGIKNKDIK